MRGVDSRGMIMSDGIAVEAPRPPRYAEALDLYRRGLVALAEGDELHELSPKRAECYVKAGALFAGAHAAAAIRLIAPLPPGVR